MDIHTIEIIGGLPVEKLNDLPIWTGEDAGRIIYIKTYDNYYFGTKSGWLTLRDTMSNLRPLGGTGRPGGTGATGNTGSIGSGGNTGPSGGTGGSGKTGGSGISGGSGGSGPTGGSGAAGPTGGSGGSGGTGSSAGTGGSGPTGGSGSAGGIGCIYGEHETGSTVSLMDMLITGVDYDRVRVQIIGQYNSFNIDPVTLGPGEINQNIMYSSDKTAIFLWKDMFYPKIPKAAVLNLAYTNLEKNIQVTIDKNFYIKIFHPLDGKFQKITPFILSGKSIMVQIFYITSHGTLILP